MEVYLIRHGETGGNKARRHQADDTPLSFEGVNQAKGVAEHVQTLEPTHLLSSSLVRAVETARIIGETCNLVPDISTHFIELARPRHMFGHFHRSPKSLFFYLQWYLGSSAATAAGGESYADLRARFAAAEEVLQAYPADARVAVVSHSVFMTLFIAHLCRAKPLTPLQAALAFRKIVTIPNVHIEPLLFNPELPADTCAWQVDR